MSHYASWARSRSYKPHAQTAATFSLLRIPTSARFPTFGGFLPSHGGILPLSSARVRLRISGVDVSPPCVGAGAAAVLRAGVLPGYSSRLVASRWAIGLLISL